MSKQRMSITITSSIEALHFLSRDEGTVPPPVMFNDKHIGVLSRINFVVDKKFGPHSLQTTLLIDADKYQLIEPNPTSVFQIQVILSSIDITTGLTTKKEFAK